MANPTAFTPSFVTLRRELGVARTTYRAIAARKVKDDAPVESQHAYWRVHDTARAVYGRLDWRYQSLILRGGLLASAGAALATLILPQAGAVAAVALAFTAWRLYIVAERLVPWADDK